LGKCLAEINKHDDLEARATSACVKGLAEKYEHE